MSTLESYLAAKKIPNESNSNSTIDSNQNSKPPTAANTTRAGTLIKQKSQKYTKSLVDISSTVSQMDISNGNSKSNRLSDGHSTYSPSVNDVNDSLASVSVDNESENGFSSTIDDINKHSSIMANSEDYLAVNDSKIGSNNNLSSNSVSSEIVMEGWVLRKKQLQSYKKYYMIAKRRQSKAGILCFYKTENDPQSQPHSMIDLSECTDINYSPSVNSYSTQRYEFKLYLRKHDLQLATNSHETTEKWIEAIKQLLPRISKPAYDSLQQEVNSLRSSENSLRVENSKLLEMIEYYKKNIKNLEETNKQLENEVTRLKDELSLFKLENSNKQITNNNMHIKSLNQNMTKNLDKIYNKVTEQEKIEDIFKNGIDNLDKKIDQCSDSVKDGINKTEESNQILNESITTLKEIVEKRTQKIEKMVMDSQEKIKLAAEEEGNKIETNTECLKEIQNELQLFAKEVPVTMEIAFKKMLQDTIESRLESINKEMNTMSQNQAKLIEICANTAQKINTNHDESNKIINEVFSQMKSHHDENKNIVNKMITQIEYNAADNNAINLTNDDILSKLNDLTDYILNNSKESIPRSGKFSSPLCFETNEKFMKDVRLALADIETRVSRVKTQEQSNHEIQTQLIKAMNDKIHFFQQNLLFVITEKIRKFMVEEQEAKKMDTISLENRMEELKLIINTYSNSLKTAVDPTTVEYIDSQNINALMHSTIDLDREASIDNSRIEGIENSLQRVLKEVSKYNSNINMLSRQNSKRFSTINLAPTSPSETKNNTLELVGSINNSLLKIQDIIGSNETLNNDNDLQDQFNYIKSILETNKTDLEKVFVKRRNIEFLSNQINSLKSERDLLVEEVSKLS